MKKKIPEDFVKMITEMKKEYTERIDKIANENKTLKRTILEKQKFLEGMRREKLKNNIFVSGLPESYCYLTPLRFTS